MTAIPTSSLYMNAWAYEDSNTPPTCNTRTDIFIRQSNIRNWIPQTSASPRINIRWYSIRYEKSPWDYRYNGKTISFIRSTTSPCLHKRLEVTVFLLFHFFIRSLINRIIRLRTWWLFWIVLICVFKWIRFILIIRTLINARSTNKIKKHTSPVSFFRLSSPVSISCPRLTLFWSRVNFPAICSFKPITLSPSVCKTINMRMN